MKPSTPSRLLGVLTLAGLGLATFGPVGCGGSDDGLAAARDGGGGGGIVTPPDDDAGGPSAPSARPTRTAA